MTESTPPIVPGLDTAGQRIVDQRFPLVCQYLALSPPNETPDQATQRIALVAAFRSLPHDHLEHPTADNPIANHHQQAFSAIAPDCWRDLAVALGLWACAEETIIRRFWKQGYFDEHTSDKRGHLRPPFDDVLVQVRTILQETPHGTVPASLAKRSVVIPVWPPRLPARFAMSRWMP